MYAYLDNSATTKCSEAVIERVTDMMNNNFGNPSSLHNVGFEAEKVVREARKIVADSLKVDEKEIYFTSGGTESNSLAIIGAAFANIRGGNHIITTKIEHPSVLNTFKVLEKAHFDVDYIDVDKNGIINLAQLKELIRSDTILVSVMHVNNEIGAVEPIDEIARVVKMENPKCLFHVDAIQSYGKYQINPKKSNIDMLSASGHKIHGPKGCGFLYVKDKVKISPQLNGGGQEFGLRSGTENTYAIAGLGVAVTEAYENLDADVENMRAIKNHMIERLEEMPYAHVNGYTNERSAPNIVSVSFDKVRAEVMLHALEEKEIYVSSGSACSSNKPQKSKTLIAIGVEGKYLESTIRFSFSRFTTKEEVDFALDTIESIYPELSKFTRQ